MYVINGELSDLDTYEPKFFYPEEAWLEYNFTVNLTVTDSDVTEIFYFCHIHNEMSARFARLPWFKNWGYALNHSCLWVKSWICSLRTTMVFLSSNLLSMMVGVAGPAKVLQTFYFE